MIEARNNIRNIAIIAHVDHGKTTLVDQMLKQSGTFKEHEKIQTRVMDSGDLERERGITIVSKNTAIQYNDVKINIVDTPGHADFGGEVERILMMVDGVLLLVDAAEGVMPQTRFVLLKALEKDKRAVVVINKVDRPDARCEEVVDEIIDLFIELGATEEQIEFPVLYASARDGVASASLSTESKNLNPLFDAILTHIPAPQGEIDGPLQILISNIAYDDYIGRIGIGRVERGSVARGDDVTLVQGSNAKTINTRISHLYQFEGLERQETETASLGDIIALSGISEIEIGDTICDRDAIEPLPFIQISEPTISMLFVVNNSPFAGLDGTYVTSRNLRDRLYKELETNVSLRVEDTNSPDSFKVSGRGELHLSILIETMRREGYEFAVSRPQVIFKDIDGKRHEPIERLTIDVPEEYVGTVMEKLGSRKAELIDMRPNGQGGSRLVFLIPARGLMGYHSMFLTDTKGHGILSHVFEDYSPYKGDLAMRVHGSMIAHETGLTTVYGLYHAQGRGELFIPAGIDVYEGMIVGQNARAEDLIINVCRKKQMTNVRASGTDDALRLTPATQLSLEQMLEFIADDELVEVTPKHIRMRKLYLNKSQRDKMAKNKE